MEALSVFQSRRQNLLTCIVCAREQTSLHVNQYVNRHDRIQAHYKTRSRAPLCTCILATHVHVLLGNTYICNVFQWPCFDNSKPKNGFASCLNGKSVNVPTPTHHPILFNVSPLSRKNSGVGAGELCTELECSLSSGGQPEENYVAFETRTFYLVTLLKFRFWKILQVLRGDNRRT